jgi:hypothetical protein
MDFADLDGSWLSVGPRVTGVVSLAQLGAARDGAAYVPRTLVSLGADVDPDGDVVPGSFAGVASDGRSLSGLLDGAKVHAKAAQSLDAGGSWLDAAVHTMVSDAGRSAASVAIAARPRVGYVRMVNPPCCSRCAALAGKWFRYNTGFMRHPHCDCTHVPAMRDAAPGLTSDPPLDAVTGLSVAERQAAEHGADLGRIVNARRGSSGMTTTEGTTRRGQFAGRRRLTPDGIFRVASDREETVRLLRAYGYLT